MTYAVKEIYYTLQGEGANSGRPAVLLRFAGCNLWSGREQDRAAAVCRFCDTDFVGTDGPGGGSYGSADGVGAAVESCWPSSDTSHRFVVCTGGEPLLQLDVPLIEELHRRGFYVAIESNGTIAAPAGIDWICISPKADTSLEQKSGDELKLIYPQAGADPQQYENLSFDHFFLQPMAGPDLDRNTQLALAYCMEHPKWRLSLQTHKLIGIP